MPLYICNSVKGAIPESAKQNIAADITDIHCRVTGAPESFVHVFFLEDAPQQPLAGKCIFLFGSIRAGRSKEQKRNLTEGMKLAIQRHANVAVNAIAVDTTDVPASWVMEGGVVLPEPGEEASWNTQESQH